MTNTHKIYEREQHESLDEILDRAFAKIAKGVEAQEEALHDSPAADVWSDIFEATDKNLAMLKNDDIIRVNKNSPGIQWGAFKDVFKEPGFLAFQILIKKQKAEHYFFLNSENRRPSYLGKFHYIYEAYEQACIVHPDDDGIVVTISKITDILNQMKSMIKD